MKKQQIIKTEGKTDIIKKTSKRAKDIMLSGGMYNLDRDLAELDKHLNNLRKGEERSPEFYKSYIKVSMTMGLDTHLPMADSVLEKYAHFLVNMTRDIIREYDCKTTIEKLLAENIASSHVKIIHYSKILNDNTAKTYIGLDETDFLEMIGKEIDRANRQLNNSILTLRQIKTPPTPFRVNVKNAYISENQQVNNYEKKDEINERQ